MINPLLYSNNRRDEPITRKKRWKCFLNLVRVFPCPCLGQFPLTVLTPGNPPYSMYISCLSAPVNGRCFRGMGVDTLLTILETVNLGMRFTDRVAYHVRKNEGQKTEMPTCSGTIALNHRIIICSSFDSTYHIKCGGVTPKQHKGSNLELLALCTINCNFLNNDALTELPMNRFPRCLVPTNKAQSEI